MAVGLYLLVIILRASRDAIHFRNTEPSSLQVYKEKYLRADLEDCPAVAKTRNDHADCWWLTFQGLPKPISSDHLIGALIAVAPGQQFGLNDLRYEYLFGAPDGGAHAHVVVWCG